MSQESTAIESRPGVAWDLWQARGDGRESYKEHKEMFKGS